MAGHQVSIEKKGPGAVLSRTREALEGGSRLRLVRLKDHEKFCSGGGMTGHGG